MKKPNTSLWKLIQTVLYHKRTRLPEEIPSPAQWKTDHHRSLQNLETITHYYEPLLIWSFGRFREQCDPRLIREMVECCLREITTKAFEPDDDVLMYLKKA
ncbi:MAG: hypothetical protein KDD15_32320, partial [Lewinella sp.]|nr:hypothetical protein [Lewinella sp.]